MADIAPGGTGSVPPLRFQATPVPAGRLFDLNLAIAILTILVLIARKEFPAYQGRELAAPAPAPAIASPSPAG